jgi:lysozyme
MSLKGIDVSHHNGSPDWGVVAGNNYLFAIAKATEGLTDDYNDAKFARNWQGIKDAGLVRGAYHFAWPSNNSAEDEADHFLAQLDAAGGLETGDLLALDLESKYVGDLHDWTLTWLQRVERQVGFKPLFYSYSDYMKAHGLRGADDLATYPLWYAAYPHPFGDVPDAPPSWNGIVIHQYSTTGRVAGIQGDVDLDYFGGSSADDLRFYGRPGSADATPTSSYRVQPGDTWQSIADQFGVSAGDLQAANPNIDQLDTDIVLKIPTMATA